MRAALVIELLVVLGVRPFFAGGLLLGEKKGWKWQESSVYVIGAVPLMGGWLWAMFVYFYSTDQAWMYLGLPDLVRWMGLIASLAASVFLIWVFKTIGTAGAKTIVTFDDMTLATTGPYSRVRHPMYSGLFCWSVTWLLFTDNWVVAAPFAGFMVFIAIVRVPHEERVLVAHFGDQYRRYMARTSRFLPFGPRQGRGPA
jgi:protein-S-isoprenylcysteine O-methyltransferase Ste14